MNGFDMYKNIATMTNNDAVLNGRYPVQQHAMPFIVEDVIKKLDITADDTVLDIGCGSGTITMAIAQRCKKIYGLDNGNIIQRITENAVVPDNCFFVSMNRGGYISFNNELDGVNKIFVYSVSHYLKDLDEFFSFMDKALTVLPSGGKLLIGDIPNVDKKKRFLASPFGKKFDEEYAKKTNAGNSIHVGMQGQFDCIKFNDAIIAKIVSHYHEKNGDVYVLPQPCYLPFGYTREDILICRC